MKILITGGAGFIGFHPSRYLLDEGHSVTVYDKLDPRVSSPTSLQWLQHPRCQLVEADILDQTKLVEAVKHQDVVIHAAAQTSIDLSIMETPTTFTTRP